MKKTYLAYFLLLLVLSACGGKKGHSISLEGEIKGLGNDTLYIYGTDRLYNRMDTVVVTQDKFSVELSADTLVMAWMLFSDGTEYPLYLNKGNELILKGSAAQIDALEIKGNVPNEEYSAFVRELKGIAKPSEKALEEKAEAFIKTHPFSLVSIYLLEKYFVLKPQPDYDRIEQLIEQMSGELKDRPFVDRLVSLIQKCKRVEVKSVAPFFQLNNPKGELINRGTFKDKYLLVHFWASWDSLSCQQNATYKELYKKEAKNKYFALLGVSLDIDKARWKEVLKRDTLKWEQVCDSTAWEADVVQQFAIHALPANVLINPVGRIEGRDMSRAQIEKKLKDIEQSEKEKEKEKKKKPIEKRVKR